MPVKLIVDDPSRQAVYTLHQVHESLNKLEDKMYRKYGITTQKFVALAAIKSIPPPVTPTAISEWLDRNTNSITLMLDRMEKDGLVSRVRDLEDRRSLRLEITEKGERTLRLGIRHHIMLNKQIMSCLSLDDIKELSKILEKILEKTFETRRLKVKIMKEVKVK